MRRTHGRGSRRGDRRSRLALAATLASVLAAAVIATAAPAQDGPTVPDDPASALPDPYETGEQAAGEQDLDTDITPQAKETDLFQQFAGAGFDGVEGSDGTQLVQGSATGFDTDLYDVSFRNPRNGLAVGTRCADPQARADGESAADYGRRVSECERVPAIYRFTHPQGQDPRWEPVDLPGEGDVGYAGAVDWVDPGTAIAVGGTGEFPRREHERPPGETYEDWVARDPAGAPRAWLLDGGRWRELDLSAQIAEGMRGLTALDYHPTQPAGLAGGLGQIWHLEGAQFTQKINRTSPTSVAAGDPRITVENPALFLYRVREIRWAESEKPQAVALTSGCCAETRAQDFPRTLFYRESAVGGDGSRRWFVRALGFDATDDDGDVTGAGAYRTLNTRQELPDSLYSFNFFKASNFDDSLAISVLYSPGGPVASSERPSVLSQRICMRNDGLVGPGFNFFTTNTGAVGDPAFAAGRTQLSTVRLVSSDGDRARSAPLGRNDTQSAAPGTMSGACGIPGEVPGDAIPDWSVGELRATRLDGLGARALAYATHLRPYTFPDTVNADYSLNVPKIIAGKPEEGLSVTPGVAEIVSGNYRPTTEEKARAYLAARYFLLPTYSLNAIDVIGLSDSGWAVGDRGAILKLGSDSGTETQPENEPDPPRLGTQASRPLASREPYAGSWPPSGGEAGAVPALRAREEIRLPEPGLLPSGSPDPNRPTNEQVEDVGDIVMSRDGSEGWAIGHSEPAGQGLLADPMTSLYHYQGGVWSRCDPVGIRGQLEPDPACEGIAGLRRFLSDVSGGQRASVVRLVDAARVPLELDEDPSNDDEFEVVAVGGRYRARPGDPETPAMIHYEDGRWRLEDAEVRAGVAGTQTPRAIEFIAPDDGWILGSGDSFGFSDGAPLYHFNGERWADCAQAAAECGNPGERLGAATGAKVRGMVVAGDRLFLYGNRVTAGNAAVTTAGRRLPLIVHHDPGGGWEADPEGGGLDPGFGQPPPPPGEGVLTRSEQGRVQSLGVARLADGSFSGWALGDFGGTNVNTLLSDVRTMDHTMLRLEHGRWEPFDDPGAAGDDLGGGSATSVGGEGLLSRTNMNPLVLPGAGGEAAAFMAPRNSNRIYRLNEERGRWELVPSDRPPGGGGTQAVAPDGRGGFWAAVRNGSSWGGPGSQVYFFHYTDRAPAPVFGERSHPFTDGIRSITALAAAADGSVWLGSDSERIARYDRVTGWETTRIPGWDPGRVVTRPSEVNAIAVGPDGSGIAVGKAGRIADLSPDAVRLDRAAGKLCDLTAPVEPCGTGRDLLAAAVAPDGSALAGGEALTLLWRPSGGEFRAVARPPTASSSSITGISMPSPGRAWLTTTGGGLFAGELAGGGWSWQLENENPDGELLAVDTTGGPLSLDAIAVDAGGHGYAVGQRGLILERTGDGDSPWRRLRTPFLDDFTAVTLQQQGWGALIGGRNGIVLTAAGRRVEVARPADYFNLRGVSAGANLRDGGATTGRIVGLAVLPGVSPGQAEAWAATPAKGIGDSRLFHYASDPSEPRLSGSTAEPLPDVPPPRPGEIPFAAFGKSECHYPSNRLCPAPVADLTDHDAHARAVADAIRERAAQPGGPAFAIFSGDAVDSATLPGSGAAPAATGGFLTNGPVKLRRWSELVADRLDDGGVPLLGAIGSQDLSEVCVADLDGNCFSTKQAVKSGDNLVWREVMARRASPWGGGGQPASNGALTFEPVPGADEGSRRFEDVSADPDGDGPLTPSRVPAGGASTHYAVEALRDGEKVARIVVVDSSLRSLATSDPVQQPAEPNGGQTAWLERMICARGDQTSTGAPCSREPDQQAIVVSNTPTYSYGPGTLTDTAADGTALEELFFRHGVNVVVSGRLGWNALYWATAPALHDPGPGGTYPATPPAPGPTGETPMPFVVASGAGGKFGPDGTATGSASEGFWHGYTLVRLPPDGERTETVVEQRPLLDWIQLDAREHVVRPGKTLPLRAIGREPVVFDPLNGGANVTRFDEITTPAITHRFDLLLADPDEPWLPKQGTDSDACDPYDCVDPSIATVDRHSGQVRAGRGNYPRTFAVAQLSVGEHSATYPLVFEPRSSFRAPAPPPPVPVAVPAPPPPPAAAPPTTPSVNLPAAPVLPVLTAQALAPPPVPPPPPTFASQAPLDLNLSPAALDVTPPTAVSQPPTPPVNPAPPSGARREARQRQAAAQKSGADSGAEGMGDEVDKADQPRQAEGAEMTRHDFTAVADRTQPSAWTRDALIGGGLGVAALILALGLHGARPTPRRRPPEVPAPAWSKSRRWR